ncbi:histidine kinase dimerization/phosphoacceptor domain -containing protein [Citreimonas salinaria]|nr:histidine kinase dimerization/phosphoacceptor domain -containing protein [Citreimonas salinaria]
MSDRVAGLALADHPVPTLVTSLGGEIRYANKAALSALGLGELDPCHPPLLDEWATLRGTDLGEMLAMAAASSNWLPLRLQRGEDTLHLRARGLPAGDGARPAVLMTAAANATADFRTHSQQIRKLNEQLALHRRTEAKLKASVEASEILKRELVHRVKNNLSIMSALLRTEARSAQDGAISAALLEASGRIMSISVVHEILDEAGHADEIDLKTVLTLLVDRVRESICPAHVTLRAQVCPVSANINKALPVALLVNELITNAIKHAFEGRAAGRIDVTLRRRPGGCRLQVSDDGIGMLPDAHGVQRRPRIVTALADQLGAERTCVVEGGTEWTIDFSL